MRDELVIGKVRRILQYPIKGLRGVITDEIIPNELEVGLPNDHLMVLVRPEGVISQEDGAVITLRSTPQLALLKVMLDSLGNVTVRDPRHASEITLDRIAMTREVNEGLLTDREVNIWDKVGGGIDLGDERAAWFSRAIGQECRLVFRDRRRLRQADPEKAGPNVQISFQDGFPIHVTFGASVAMLAAAAGYSCTKANLSDFGLRFRPQIEIETDTPLCENSRRMRLLTIRPPGRQNALGTVLESKCPCERCQVPATDPFTGEYDPKVLAALAKYFKIRDLVAAGNLDERASKLKQNKPAFGWNCLLVKPGSSPIRPGDDVYIPIPA